MALWPLSSLLVPVFDRPYDVIWVGRTKHNLDFVHGVVIGILEEQVEPAPAWAGGVLSSRLRVRAT
jgi:hypothetical protein